MTLDPRLRSSKEGPLFVLAVIFSTGAWLLAIVATLGLGLLYIGLVAFFVLAAHAVFLAHVRGNGIRVSRQQLPALEARCEAIALKLRLSHMPEVYLMQPRATWSQTRSARLVAAVGIPSLLALQRRDEPTRQRRQSPTSGWPASDDEQRAPPTSRPLPRPAIELANGDTRRGLRE